MYKNITNGCEANFSKAFDVANVAAVSHCFVWTSTDPGSTTQNFPAVTSREMTSRLGPRGRQERCVLDQILWSRCSRDSLVQPTQNPGDNLIKHQL